MTIFVANLAFTATEDEVRQLFEGHGTVDTVRLMTDRDTGRPRGFGFVEMPDATQARAAIAGLNGTNLGGRPLTINEARPREERDGHSGVGHDAAPGGKRHACTTPVAGGPMRPRRPAAAPLPGSLCERCQDAPAVQWQPAPGGGEMGVCPACREPEGRTDGHG